MSYIRTKDGIWQYNQENNSAERPNKEFQCNQIWLNIKEKDILKQADTIEELIDGWVIEPDKGYYIYNKGLKELREETDIYDSSYGLLKITNKYGAIWTERGLIYVAKMNKKGELELLGA